MPLHLVITTPQEVFQEAIHRSRELSAEILRLADVQVSPLMPGETPDARRHQIAKLGKQLAETFITLDNLMREVGDAFAKAHGIDTSAAGPVKPDNPDAN